MQHRIRAAICLLSASVSGILLPGCARHSVHDASQVECPCDPTESTSIPKGIFGQQAIDQNNQGIMLPKDPFLNIPTPVPAEIPVADPVDDVPNPFAVSPSPGPQTERIPVPSVSVGPSLDANGRKVDTATQEPDSPLPGDPYVPKGFPPPPESKPSSDPTETSTGAVPVIPNNTSSSKHADPIPRLDFEVDDLPSSTPLLPVITPGRAFLPRQKSAQESRVRTAERQIRPRSLRVKTRQPETTVPPVDSLEDSPDSAPSLDSPGESPGPNPSNEPLGNLTESNLPVKLAGVVPSVTTKRERFAEFVTVLTPVPLASEEPDRMIHHPEPRELEPSEHSIPSPNAGLVETHEARTNVILFEEIEIPAVNQSPAKASEHRWRFGMVGGTLIVALSCLGLWFQRRQRN